VVLPRDGTVSGTVAAYVRDLERAPGEVVTVVIPALFARRSLLMLLLGVTALVPMAELNMAPRRAVRYAVGLGASRVHGLHVALDADDGGEVAARLDT